MKKLLVFLLLISVCLVTPAQRRGTRQRQPTQREQLQKDREKIIRNREANQRKRKELEEKVKRNMQEVEALTHEIQDKRQLVDSIRGGIIEMNANIAVLDSQLTVLKQELEERRLHYIQSVRYMYRNRRVQNQMMFVLSAQNLNQMYRRMRFMKEYTTYQRAQGEAVKQKREQVDQKHQELTAVREQMQLLLARGEQEQRLLEGKQAAQKELVAQLQKEKQTVQALITQQQKQEAELNAKIDRLIAEELRKAEEERQRKLAEERRRREEIARNNNSGSSGSGSSRRNENRRGGNTETTAPAYNPAAADQQLSGNFASNKGRLPVPITGAYRLIRKFGPYTLEGVTLDSKGIHLQGQAGAQARCVFDGEVSRVYHPDNTYIVMVRHGRYISVYCNLSSACVTAGQKVKTNQILGTVGPSLILQFRLQNWTELLDPKPWLSRLH